MPIAIAIVEDHAIVRQGIVSLLGTIPEMQVVAEFNDAESALARMGELRPDIVLMDIALPGMSSVDATRTIVSKHAPTRVIALTNFKDASHVTSMVHAGAMGYVIKEKTFDDLVDAIRSVAGGEHYLSSMSSILLGRLHNGHPSQQTLTPREEDVLRLLAAGKPMKEAALELRISTKTVETHRRSIMEKLQLFSVAELTKHAIRTGLATLD